MHQGGLKRKRFSMFFRLLIPDSSQVFIFVRADAITFGLSF